jgi:lipid II:glycine glycyltransferase (peptidoglycan interpeptide bridge formation enzyme)
MFDNAPQGEPEPEQRPVTANDIYRNQRANLALRALDLEAEVVLLQQEKARLEQENAQLKAALAGAPPEHEPKSARARAGDHNGAGA